MNRREYLASHLGLAAKLSVGSVAVGVAGCSGRRESLATIEGATMGTTYRVKALVDEDEIDSLAADIEAIVARVDTLMSTYRPESELSRFNANAGSDWFALSADTHAVLRAAADTAAASAGAFDPTVGPLVNLWGFGPDGPSDDRLAAAPSDGAIADVVARVGLSRLVVADDRPAARKSHPDLYADLSGIAKGYAVDRIAGRLDTTGSDGYLVEVGGELRARGRKADGGAWRVGIERPARDRHGMLAVIEPGDRAIATSGDYRNFFAGNGGRIYSHAIDPASGRPVAHDLAAASVVAPTTMQADALSTALMVMGPERGREFAYGNDLAALLVVRRDGELVELETPAFTRLRAVL